MLKWARERGRRHLWAIGLYGLVLLVYLLTAGKQRLVEHTPFNHFALLAEAWLDGRLDLGGPPPDYAQGNDFARYHGRWYVTFPALPALLILPFVKIAGSAERVRDAQFFIWLAPLGPTLLFAILERLRELGRTLRSRRENLMLAGCFAFGSVYYFTAVQGTVWFAAHVVAVACCGGYLLASLQARHPWLAGLMLGLGFWARAPVLFAFPVFLAEALASCSREPPASDASGPARGWPRRLAAAWSRVDGAALSRRLAAFTVPIAALGLLAMLHNYARFDHPFDFGYHHLQVAWSRRIDRWGLVHLHYLPRNLGVILTSLPWLDPLRVNVHGLALWLTTPLYLFVIWPGKTRPGFGIWLLAAAAVSWPTLFYQNTGWQQFGYRFSNDYALMLFVALALTTRRWGALVGALAVWGLLINTFGALTFDRARYSRYYYSEPSQRQLYQPD